MSKQLNFFDPLKDQIGNGNGKGNTRLVDYGIQNEKSDYRAHVSYVTQQVYIFPMVSGVKAIEAYAGPSKDVITGNITTAKGYPIPVSHIDGIAEVMIPLDIFQANFANRKEATSTKGLKATNIVVAMIKRNLIPLPLQVDVTDDQALQISGCDIIVHSRLKIQVKCDYRAGNKRHSPKATGNLFLQIAECNPFKYT